jgi:N-acetylneuraminate synthase
MSLFLVAEIGINHNGDLDIARQLIAAAHTAGFDAVKFQKRAIEKVYTREFLDSPRESPWGSTQRDQKRGLEFTREQYGEIDRYCRERGILWFASAWDVDSQLFLRDFDLPYNKVASAMLGNWPLLRMVAEEKKKTFISTGMSTLEEIDEVVAYFRTSGCPFELMHTNSTYPMKESDANLRCIPMLRERYRCDVGYSGHETTLIKVCVAAVALGATSLERHITLDRAMYGSDQAASISAHVLDDFVNSVRAIEGILGDGQKTIAAGEQPIRQKLRVDVPRDVILT